MRLRNLVVAMVVAGCPAGAIAQTSRPGATTTAAARHEMVVPRGFEVIEVAGRRVVAEKGDAGWIRKAMTELAPATRPTTAPADLVVRLKARRGELQKEMVADLALDEEGKKAVGAFLDKQVGEAERYRDMRPPVYYLATTRSKVQALVKGGWKDPRYYYNRAADEVMIDTGMRLSAEGPMDDMLLPALYPDDAPESSKAAILMRTVQATERLTTDEIARRARVGMQVGFITFMIDTVFRPMGLKAGEDWLGVGVSGVLSAKYTAEVTGESEATLVGRMTAESPRIPIHAATVDLLHPTDLNVLREQAVPFYLDAVRRKATGVVRDWLGKAGPGALPKVIAALRKGAPKDGEGLVKLIKAETGVDLSREVGASGNGQ